MRDPGDPPRKARKVAATADAPGSPREGDPSRSHARCTRCLYQTCVFTTAAGEACVGLGVPSRELQRTAWEELERIVSASGGFERDGATVPKGFVHPGVSIGWDDAGARGLFAVAPIASGDEIFRIPPNCVLSASEALRSDVGERIRENVARADDDPPRVPLGDLALAAALVVDQAFLGVSASPTASGGSLGIHPKRRRRLPLLTPSLEESSDHACSNDRCVTVGNPSSFFPYHALLRAEDFDDDASRWPEATRETHLAGTSVLESAERVAADEKDAFERFVAPALTSAYFRSASHDPSPQLLFSFRRALATVRSRSFHAEEEAPSARTNARLPRERLSAETSASESLRAALVPMVDLANHHRKPRECAFAFHPSTGVRVTALRAFAPGDPVRISYGARGVADLLLRYGFVVADNVEPDGSSNDVFPLKMPGWDQKDAVELRVAPDAKYTYPALAEAVTREMMKAAEDDEGAARGRSERDDARGSALEPPPGLDEDRDVFLGDGDGDDDAEDIWGEGGDDDDEEEEEGADEVALESERDALERVEAALARRVRELDETDPARRRSSVATGEAEEGSASAGGPGSSTRDPSPASRRAAANAAVVRESERRTCAFFRDAAEAARRALDARKDFVGGLSGAAAATVRDVREAEEARGGDASERPSPGVAALVAAYFKIRHRVE
jgi:hypothetical protein